MHHAMHLVHGTALQAAPLPALESPIGGITPSFNFGGPFNSWWKSVFAAVWGAVILFCLVFCLLALTKIRSSDDNPMQHKQGKTQLMHAAIALGASIAFGVIVSAIFWIAG